MSYTGLLLAAALSAGIAVVREPRVLSVDGAPDLEPPETSGVKGARGPDRVRTHSD